jgi:hypothetical protein
MPEYKHKNRTNKEQMIIAANRAQHIAIDARMFRDGIANEDGICYDMLDPKVAEYVREQYQLAARNNRAVGADQSADKLTVADLRLEKVGQPAEANLQFAPGVGS